MNNYLCFAKLHTRNIHCINDSSNCLFKFKNFNEIFYYYNRLGYSIICNVTCQISSAGVISKIISANGFYYVPFHISGFAHCGENCMLALEKREFIYELNYEIKQPSSYLNLVDFSVEDWSDVSKLNELQTEDTRNAFAKIKDFIHENNVVFVGILTLILTITVIGGSLFLCYYFKCYSVIYAKLVNFYLRTRQPKNKFKAKDIVVFKNEHHSEKLKASIVPHANLEAVEPGLDERHDARITRNQPSPVLRSNITSQDLMSNRITLDF